MRKRPSFYHFISKHVLAVLAAFVVHVAVAAVFALQHRLDFTSRFATVDLARIQTTEKQQQVQPLNDEPEQRIIQTQVASTKQIEQQVKRLRARKVAEQKLQKRRLTEIQSKREQEEKRIKRLQSKQSDLKKQFEQLQQRKQKSAEELHNQQLAAVAAEQKLAEITLQQKQSQQTLADLQKQGNQAKQVNKQLIAQALENQRLLEKQRIAEEAKIKQVANRKVQLQQQAEQERLRLAQLEEQGEQQTAALQQSLNQLSEIQQSELQKLKQQYITRIRQRVRSNWFNPDKQEITWTCEVMVQQSLQGEVQDVRLRSCSQGATRHYKNSIIKAVNRSNPLPEPPDPKVFEAQITFKFIP